MSKEAFIDAVIGGDDRIVDFFLAAGLSPNLNDGAGGSLLMLAIAFDHVYIMNTLLEHGADVNYVNGDGMSALQIAVGTKLGVEEPPYINPYVAALLQTDVDINNISGGWAPLHFAANGTSVHLAKALVDAGADIDAKVLVGNRKGYTAIDIAKGNRTEPMQQFLQREKNKRTAAALSVMPKKTPQGARQYILELMRRR